MTTDALLQVFLPLVTAAAGFLFRHYLVPAAPAVATPGVPAPIAVPVQGAPSLTPAAQTDWLPRHPVIQGLLATVASLVAQSSSPLSAPASATAASPINIASIASQLLNVPMTLSIDGHTIVLSQNAVAVSTKAPAPAPAPAAAPLSAGS